MFCFRLNDLREQMKALENSLAHMEGANAETTAVSNFVFVSLEIVIGRVHSQDVSLSACVNNQMFSCHSMISM